MGKLNRALFGGNKQRSSSESGNKFADFLKEGYGGGVGQFNQSSDMLSRLLGLSGGGAQEDAYGAFRNTPGYQFAREEGLAGVNGKFSGSGMLGSGARDKAMMQYGTGLADQTYASHMERLFGLSKQGLAAGDLISGAGDVDKQKSKGTSANGGIGTLVGAFLSGPKGSERRIKENIVRIGELADGLGIYEYEYNADNKHWGEGKQIGVMVDEVQTFRPWALGPVIDGVQTVDYTKIEGDA